MSKAFAIIAALACLAPAYVACSSSDNNTGTKKDSGTSDDDSTADDDDHDTDTGDDDTEDAGKKDAKADACVSSSLIAIATARTEDPASCKTCLQKSCKTSCAITDLLTCASSECPDDCVLSTPDAGATDDDAGSTTSDGGKTGEGGAAGASCAKLKSCCPIVSLGYPDCDKTAAGGNEAICAGIVNGAKQLCP